MSKALIIAEIKNGSLTKTSCEIASKAANLGFEAHALTFGADATPAQELGKYGVAQVTHIEIASYNGEIIAQAAADHAAENYQAIFMPHSWAGRDIAGRIGSSLKSPIISDVVDLTLEGDRLLATKPIYAGKAFAKLKSKAPIQIFTVRPNAFEVDEKGGAAEVTTQKVDAAAKANQTAFKETAGSKIGLTEADIIISGGRGIKGPEFFPVLQEIADLLGAALGASRATVDAGWIDHSHQVGQTGKTVSPNLYIAVGISGAIQHLAGMGSSKYIVAINKDPDAPIFKVASYGVVDDLFDVIPPFKEELKKLKG